MTEPDKYTLAEEPGATAEQTGAVPVPARVLPLAYRSDKRRFADRYDLLESSPLKHLYAPIVLMLAGSAAVFVELCYGDFDLPITSALRATGYVLTWNIVVMLAGVYLVARWIGSAFGHLSTALVRLAAVAIFPMGVAAIINFATNSITSTLLGWLASIAAYWVLFWWLFELDTQETLIAVGVTTVLRWASYLLYWIVLMDYLPRPF
jgi:hypothetical protein